MPKNPQGLFFSFITNYYIIKPLSLPENVFANILNSRSPSIRLTCPISSSIHLSTSPSPFARKIWEVKPICV